MKIHKSAKHKEKKSKAQPTPKTIPFPSSNQPIPCIRHSDGCQNIVHSYFTNFTAMCESCKVFMSSLKNSSPFSSALCPCCHEPSKGNSYSLCSTCLEYLYKEGFTESEWGSWVLDENSGEIVCQQLDF